MTLDEAIKHAEEVAEEQDMKSGFETDNQTYIMSEEERKRYRECAKEHRQLAEWLKELKQLREQTTWIPVSERLPKEEGNYLVCYNDGYIAVSEWHPNPYEKVCFDMFPDLIVAWMPRPKPYKAEEE